MFPQFKLVNLGSQYSIAHGIQVRHWMLRILPALGFRDLFRLMQVDRTTMTLVAYFKYVGIRNSLKVTYKVDLTTDLFVTCNDYIFLRFLVIQDDQFDVFRAFTLMSKTVLYDYRLVALSCSAIFNRSDKPGCKNMNAHEISIINVIHRLVRNAISTDHRSDLTIQEINQLSYAAVATDAQMVLYYAWMFDIKLFWELVYLIGFVKHLSPTTFRQFTLCKTKDRLNSTFGFDHYKTALTNARIIDSIGHIRSINESRLIDSLIMNLH